MKWIDNLRWKMKLRKAERFADKLIREENIKILDEITADTL